MKERMDQPPGPVARTIVEKERGDLIGTDFGVPAKYNEEARRFVDYMVAKERERCAKLCEAEQKGGEVFWSNACLWLATAIRKG